MALQCGLCVLSRCFSWLFHTFCWHCSGLLVFCFGDAVTCFNMSRKQKALTLKEKPDILSKVDENLQKKRVDLARELGLPVSTLNTIVSKREEIHKKIQVFSAGVKQTRGVQHGKMEQVLLAWFKEVQAAA